MAGEWPTTKIGDVCLRVTKGTTPTTGGGAFTDRGIAFIKVEAITESGGFLPEKFAFIDTETDEKLARSRLQEKDILFTIAGTIGRVAQVTNDILPANTNQAVAIVRPNPDLIFPRFLYYVLRDSKRIQLAQSRVVQSVQANFSLGELSAVELPLPPQEEQRAIAHILGTLDDKIELNRRMSETLEAMARALFKAWFVDFEPVRAKMEGRWRRGESLPGLPAHLYDLFPDRLVDSELGETNSPRANLDDGIGGPQGGGRESRRIPEGWEWAPASRLIEFNPPETLRKGTVAPYIEMSALPTSGSWPEPPVLRPFGSGMRFRNGDTLLARITPCLENGKTAFVQCLPDNAVGWGSTEFIVMRPRHPVPKEFGYLLARDEAFRAHAIRSMTGTSGRQRVQADSVANFPIAMPSNEDLWQEFARLVSPAFKSIKANAEAVETLAELRDTLLPKLISGELRIADAEKPMEKFSQ